jgi:GNAT superfamily N-acetyltransferase
VVIGATVLAWVQGDLRAPAGWLAVAFVAVPLGCGPVLVRRSLAARPVLVAGAIGLYGYYGPAGGPDGVVGTDPSDLVGPDAPPVFIASGGQDTVVPAQPTARLVARLREVSRSPVVHAELPHAQHSFDLVHSIRMETLVDAVEAFAMASMKPRTGDDQVVLRPGRPDEADELLELAIRSKAVWGYDASFLDACRDELRLGRSGFADGRVVVAAAADETLLGYSRFSRGAGGEGELDALFVDPSAIGTGVGGRLFRDVVEHARRVGVGSFRIEADPNAAAFYEHMGAVPVGTTPSGSIAGRVLPVLRYDVVRQPAHR